MGLIYAEIELINADDLAMVRRNVIDKDEVRHIFVNALVDTGSYMLAINENIQEQLDLPVLEKRKAQMADGSIKECEVVGPIELKFKNRRTLTHAMVLPGDSEVLLGAIPLEDMDVLIDPLREHPYFAQMKMK